MKLITKIGGKALPRLGGNGKIPGGIPHLKHHHDDGLDTDGTAKLAKISKWSIYLWNVTDGGCKEYTSYYRKLATKSARIQHEQQHEH